MKKQIIAVVSIVGALMSYFGLWSVVQWTGHNQGILIPMPFNIVSLTWWTTANLLVATGATFTAIIAVMALLDLWQDGKDQQKLAELIAKVENMQKYLMMLEDTKSETRRQGKPTNNAKSQGGALK